MDGLDFIERVKTQQKNWIGRSTGAEVTFRPPATWRRGIYTTRPDTLFGATYGALPEHELVRKWLEGRAEERRRDAAYQKAAASSRPGAHGAEQGRPACLDGVRGVNPVNGRSPSSSPTACSHTWHRRHHGRTRPRRPGLGFAEVRARSSRWSPVVRTCSRPPSRQGRHHPGQLRLPQRQDREGCHPRHDPVAGGEHRRGKVNTSCATGSSPPAVLGKRPIPMVYCEKCGWPMPEEQLPVAARGGF